jgi:hypothetical protein
VNTVCHSKPNTIPSAKQNCFFPHRRASRVKGERENRSKTLALLGQFSSQSFNKQDGNLVENKKRENINPF